MSPERTGFADGWPTAGLYNSPVSNEEPSDPRDLIWGEAKRAITRRLERLDADLERMVRDFAYGEVYARGMLEPKVQEFLAVAMLLALGSPDEIRTHLRGALNAGASEQELREVILFAVPYLGFPRAIAGMAALKGLLEQKSRPAPEPGG